MSDETLECVKVKPLDSGFVVTRIFFDEYAELKTHRTAEPTLYGALTLVARTLGYRGLIRFEPEHPASGTVNAPYIPSPNERLAEVPVYANVPFDAPEVFDDEIPLRAAVGGKL